MDNFFGNLASRVSSFFQPKQQSAQQSYQPTLGKLQAPWLNDPYIQYLSQKNALDQVQNKIEPMLAPTRAILAYTGANKPKIGPPSYQQQAEQSSQPQSQPASQVAYHPPESQRDPNQTMALFSMLRNLTSQGIPSSVLPSSISTTPYVMAANDLQKRRQSIESQFSPSSMIS